MKAQSVSGEVKITRAYLLIESSVAGDIFQISGVEWKNHKKAWGILLTNNNKLL